MGDAGWRATIVTQHGRSSTSAGGDNLIDVNNHDRPAGETVDRLSMARFRTAPLGWTEYASVTPPPVPLYGEDRI